MKITKSKLKQIIKEEFDKIRSDLDHGEDQYMPQVGDVVAHREAPDVKGWVSKVGVGGFRGGNGVEVKYYAASQPEIESPEDLIFISSGQ